MERHTRRGTWEQKRKTRHKGSHKHTQTKTHTEGRGKLIIIQKTPKLKTLVKRTQNHDTERLKHSELKNDFHTLTPLSSVAENNKEHDGSPLKPCQS